MFIRTSLAAAMLIGMAECFAPVGLGIPSARGLRMVSEAGKSDETAHLSTPPPDSMGVIASRRAVIFGAALATMPSLAHASDDSKEKADKLAKQMAVVNFTKRLDEATEKAFKLAKKGDLKGAVKQWDLVVSIYETGGDDGVVLTPQALFRLGKSYGERANCLAELGQQRKQEKFFELAIGDYRKSLQYVQNNDLRLKLSSALVALGKYTEAEKELGIVLVDGVSNEVKGRALTSRGLARERLGKWEEAVFDFTDAVEATRGTPEAVSNLALAKFQVNQDKDRKMALDMLMGQVKSNPAGLATIEGAQDIPMAVAAMEFASGQKDEALKSVKKVTDPRYRDLRYVAEGRLWPPSLVEALKGLLEEASKAGV